MNRIKSYCSAFIFVLCISGSQFSVAADWLYTVRPGDTFWQLCREYTTKADCWQVLPGLNKVQRTRQLPPGYVIRIPVEWLKQAPNAVTITYLKGEVAVQFEASAEPSSPIKGDTLPIGALITTANGYANLRFTDGSMLYLEPNSVLVLDTFSTFEGQGMVDSRVRLNRGSVKARVVKRNPATNFQITTPAAVAAVRGTEYRVTSIEGNVAEMRSEVFEGLVQVATPNSEKPVAAGYGIAAKVGESLKEPRPLLLAPKLQFDDKVKMLPLLLSWKNVDGANAYILELFNDNTDEELLISRATVESNIELADLTPACYRARVRGLDDIGLRGLPSENRLCIAPTLAVPVLHVTALGKSSKSEATLTWGAIDLAEKYSVQLASDAAFTKIIHEENTEQTEYAFSNSQTVYIRISAVGREGQVTVHSNALEWEPEKRSFWQVLFVIAFAAVIAL
ncbi:MAG: hypothetical protein ACI93R_000398 [Flavobacteriales bacterium]|jgi:hypothetical protein